MGSGFRLMGSGLWWQHSPYEEGGPRQRCSGAYVSVTMFAAAFCSSVFHAAGTLSAPSGHLPLEGKAKPVREAATFIPHSSKAFIHNQKGRYALRAPPNFPKGVFP